MKCCVHTYKSTELLGLPRYVRIFRNIRKSVYIRSGNRFNSEKSPHPPPGDVGDSVAVFQIVLALIGDHSITKAAPLQRRKIVFLAPHLVNLIQFFRTDGTVCFQPNISLGFQKIKNIIIVPFDSLPVLFDDLEGDKVVRNNVFTRKITYQMTDQSRTEYYSVIK